MVIYKSVPYHKVDDRSKIQAPADQGTEKHGLSVPCPVCGNMSNQLSPKRVTKHIFLRGSPLLRKMQNLREVSHVLNYM